MSDTETFCLASQQVPSLSWEECFDPDNILCKTIENDRNVSKIIRKYERLDVLKNTDTFAQNVKILFGVDFVPGTNERSLIPQFDSLIMEIHAAVTQLAYFAEQAKQIEQYEKNAQSSEHFQSILTFSSTGIVKTLIPNMKFRAALVEFVKPKKLHIDY